MKTAINIALNNGWDMFGVRWLEWAVDSEDKVLFFGPNHKHFDEIIFNLDFAKALFGEVDEWYTTKCTCGGNKMHVHGFDTHDNDCARPKANRGFEYHLKQLALSPNRQKYLSEYVEGL